MPRINEVETVLRAAEKLIKETRKAWPNAKDAAIKSTCQNAVAMSMDEDEAKP